MKNDRKPRVSKKGGGGGPGGELPPVGKVFDGDQGGKPPPSDPGRLPFIPDQVILAGPGSLMGGIPGLKEIWRVELPALDAPAIDRVRNLMGGADRGGKVVDRLGAEPWVIAVFRILWDNQSPVEWVKQINETTSLLADANFITGDPHTPVGSPHTPVGSPCAGNGKRATPADFQAQWVWQGSHGIELTEPVQGQNGACRIGVFDTSPFPFDAWGAELDVHIPWAIPPLQLRVHCPEPVAMLPPPAGGLDIREHGLSVASLAHRVAPDGEVVLYRVLDNYARGDTFTLIWALASFTADTVRQRVGGVINLSLGISGSIDWWALGLPDDIVILRLVLAIAHSLGLVIVAAAGNDSWGLESPAPAQIPARYGFVIGAEASAYYDARACFSNAGHVAAPGCGVIAAVSMPPDGYGYWSGTSFATPLVAGVAARHVPGAPSGPAARDATLNSASAPQNASDPNFRVIKAH